MDHFTFFNRFCTKGKLIKNVLAFTYQQNNPFTKSIVRIQLPFVQFSKATREIHEFDKLLLSV